MRSLHREEGGGTKSEISRLYPRHFPCKVSPERPRLCMSAVFIVSIVMYVRVGLSAMQQCVCVWGDCSSSNRAVTYFERLSSGSSIPCSPDCPRAVTLKTGLWWTCLYRRLCRFTQTPFQYLLRPFPRVCILCELASHSPTPRDIFRAVSQILPYIEACITAQPAVVQDAGLH